MDLEENSSKSLLELRYKCNQLTSDEKTLQKFRNYRRSLIDKYKFTFYDALLYKLRKAVFGPYVDIFNTPQIQGTMLNSNKFEITQWDVNTMRSTEKETFDKYNDFLEDGMQILKHVVNEESNITLDNLLTRFRYLRLVDLRVSNKLKIFNMLTQFRETELNPYIFCKCFASFFNNQIVSSI